MHCGKQEVPVSPLGASRRLSMLVGFELYILDACPHCRPRISIFACNLRPGHDVSGTARASSCICALKNCLTTLLRSPSHSPEMIMMFLHKGRNGQVEGLPPLVNIELIAAHALLPRFLSARLVAFVLISTPYFRKAHTGSHVAPNRAEASPWRRCI